MYIWLCSLVLRKGFLIEAAILFLLLLHTPREQLISWTNEFCQTLISFYIFAFSYCLQWWTFSYCEIGHFFERTFFYIFLLFLHTVRDIFFTFSYWFYIHSERRFLYNFLLFLLVCMISSLTGDNSTLFLQKLISWACR